PVTVIGGSGTDEIWINDLVDGAGSDAWTLTTNTIAKPLRTAQYTTTERIHILGSANNDTFDIESISTNELIIEGRDGSDTFNVARPSEDLDAIQGRATLTAGLGNDRLNLFDRNDTGNDSYLFDSSAGDN